MQRVKVASVSQKPGTNDKGPYVNTRVTGEDGAIFGTFVEAATQIQPGDTIELEPVVKGKYVNFTEWNMVEKGTGVAPEVPPKAKGFQGRSPEERSSIEKQVCLKCATELAIASGIDAPQFVTGIAQVFYDWLRDGDQKPPDKPLETQAAPETASPVVHRLDIDMDWLREQMQVIQKSDKGIIASLVKQYGVSGAGGLEETLKRLDQLQQDAFKKMITGKVEEPPF